MERYWGQATGEMIKRGKYLNNLIYNYVWHNLSLGEIKEKLKKEPEVNYMTNVQKAKEVMCGYFGMEKGKYQFLGYEDNIYKPKTYVGYKLFLSRIRDNTKFSDVLKMLEEYASGLAGGEEKHYILDVILPFHIQKFREFTSEIKHENRVL